MLLLRYSMIGSCSERTVQPAAERSAEASDSSKACSTLRSGGLRSRGCGREDVLLAPLSPPSAARTLIAASRDRVDQIAQGDAGLQGAAEAHQHRFRHVQRHDAGGRGEREDQAEPSGNEMPTGKRVCESPPVPTVSGSSMRFSHEWITPSPGRSAMPPRLLMNSGSVVGLDVHRLRIGGGVAERLHDQVGGETEAGQELLQLVAGHRAGGVLRAHRGHLRLAIGARRTPWPSGRPQARPTIFCASEPLAGIGRVLRQANRVEAGRPSASRALAVVAATDDQRDAAAGADFVQQHVGTSTSNWRSPRRSSAPCRVRAQLDHVAHVHLRHVELGNAPASSIVLKKIGAIFRPGRRRQSACSG